MNQKKKTQTEPVIANGTKWSEAIPSGAATDARDCFVASLLLTYGGASVPRYARLRRATREPDAKKGNRLSSRDRASGIVSRHGCCTNSQFLIACERESEAIPCGINKHIDHLNPFFQLSLRDNIFLWWNFIFPYLKIWAIVASSLRDEFFNIIAFFRPDRDGLLLAHRFICGIGCPH